MRPYPQVLHSTEGGATAARAPLEFNTGMDEVPEAIDMAVRLMTPPGDVPRQRCRQIRL